MMPFEQIEIKEKVLEKAAKSSEFKAAWKDSRNEYNLLHDITRIRKELNLTQKELAVISESTQQEISRLEKKEHSPALKTICRIVNSMGYELVLKKRL
jgi:DNA-binding XRE family transcriptional regulator